MKNPKKTILHGLGNQGNYNFYIFDKENEVYFYLTRTFGTLFKLYFQAYDEKNKEINIKKYSDFHVSTGGYSESKSRIDIFFGKKKMFVTIHCSPKLRIKFNEELFKIAKMPRPKPIKKIKHKKKK